MRYTGHFRYLPPYSPDFNPIENAFAKALWDAVGPIIDLFTPAECANYFRVAGYDPD